MRKTAQVSGFGFAGGGFQCFSNGFPRVGGFLSVQSFEYLPEVEYYFIRMKRLCSCRVKLCLSFFLCAQQHSVCMHVENFHIFKNLLETK